jgi:hypothetical protein
MRPQKTVNLVRNQGDETYEVVSDYDLNIMRGNFKVVPEKVRREKNFYGYFYIRMPK